MTKSTLRERATYATTYWVDLPDRSIKFELEKNNAELDALLKAHGQRQWAFLTAYNPHAQPNNALANQQHLKKLIEDVQQQGLTFLPGRDVSDDKSLTPEACLLIFGVPADRALQIGKRYGQAAVIVGELDQSPRLLYAEEK